LWLIADKSLQTNNLEFKSHKRCLDDTDKVIKYFNDLRNNDTPLLSEVKTELNQIKEILKEQMLMQRQQASINSNLIKLTGELSDRFDSEERLIDRFK